ncbi:MAG: GNAT family N-acetyltransferase, partial [Halodesulfurarchaeum sp.]
PGEIDAWIGPDESGDGPPVDDPSQHVIVAERNGDIVGFGQVDLEEAEIVAVYVDPAYDRQGVGTTILDALETKAMERGLEGLTLLASLNAARFYERNGYRQVERTEYELQDGVALSVIEFEKELDAGE